MKHHADETIKCVAVGKQAERIARRNKIDIIASFTEFKDSANANDAHMLMSLIVDMFSTDETYKKVTLAYTQFIKPLTYSPKVTHMLPIETDSLYMMITDKQMQKETQDEMRSAKKVYTFEPSEEEVAETVIPELLTAVIFQVLLDAYASEHSSRMVAMQNATENAGTMQDELTLTYNKARQAGITQEIAEISAGANAMS
jgi:F-type H+-transporting ATPase subunit gamma